MPPETVSCQSFANPQTHFLPQISNRSQFKQILDHRYYPGRQRMLLTKRKLIPVLVCILMSASILRFLKITIITSSPFLTTSTALPPVYCHGCQKNITRSISSPSLTEKETHFLMEFLSRKVPCNILIFGLEHEYLNLLSLNAGGLTVFIVEDLQKETKMVVSTNNSRVYTNKYQTLAAEAFKLLKDARESPDCSPGFPLINRCKLELTNLPHEVYDKMWDVLVVDGPRGDTPDSSGRMSTIYTASILARRGNVTHVLVHDTDRMIEKWFSWEFLCEENLVSSKGRFWDFQIVGQQNATRFCPT